MFMRKSLQEKEAYEFVLISLALPIVFCSSYLDDLSDGMEMAVLMLFCGLLLWGFVQIVRIILVLFRSSFFSKRFIKLQVVK